MSNSNPYTSRKINNLAPTDGIQDPQVRAFADSLANAWQLRNGNIGADDSERFITKQEWDFLAKNPTIRALAGIGQPGSSTQEPGPGDTGGFPPPNEGTQNLIDFLASGITLVDFATIRKTSNELFASIYALTSDMRVQINIASEELDKLENDITQINTIEETSTSRSATHLWALKEQVNDPDTGLPVAMAGVIEIDKVGVNQATRSANAQATKLLIATVNDPVNGNLANTAAIIQINTVEANSTSANAKQLSGLSASVGYDKLTGQAKATADIAQLNFVDVNSTSANAKQTAGMLVTFGDPNTRNIAAINAINEVDVNSTSASARTLAGSVAYVGVKARIFVQQEGPGGAGPANPYPGTTPPYVLKVNDIWLNTSKGNQMMRWDGTSWVDGSDARVGQAAGGITNESLVRAQQDNVVAHAVNTVWGYLSNEQALVQEGSAITVIPGAGTAHKWTAVQSEVIGPQGQKLVSAIRTDLNTEVSLQDRRAKAAYSLKVEAGVNGVNAVAGMALTANVENGQATTECIFLVNKFGIYNPDLPYAWAAPFSLADGKVRINLLYIGSHIQSDIFFPAGEGGYAEGKGWKIESNGNAQFYGTTTMARVLSGSTMVDRNSGQIMSTTAVSAWTGAASGAQVHTNGKLRFYGPDWHGYTDEYHRVRSSASGISLATTVQFMGVADHKLTLWWRKNDGPWNTLSSTLTPSEGYNAATVGWAGVFGMALNEYIDFGISPTGWSLGDNNGQVDLRDFTMTVTMSNM